MTERKNDDETGGEWMGEKMQEKDVQRRKGSKENVMLLTEGMKRGKRE